MSSRSFRRRNNRRRHRAAEADRAPPEADRAPPEARRAGGLDSGTGAEWKRLRDAARGRTRPRGVVPRMAHGEPSDPRRAAIASRARRRPEAERPSPGRRPAGRRTAERSRPRERQPWSSAEEPSPRAAAACRAGCSDRASRLPGLRKAGARAGHRADPPRRAAAGPFRLRHAGAGRVQRDRTRGKALLSRRRELRHPGVPSARGPSRFVIRKRIQYEEKETPQEWKKPLQVSC